MADFKSLYVGSKLKYSLQILNIWLSNILIIPLPGFRMLGTVILVVQKWNVGVVVLETSAV